VRPFAGEFNNPFIAKEYSSATYCGVASIDYIKSKRLKDVYRLSGVFLLRGE